MSAPIPSDTVSISPQSGEVSWLFVPGDRPERFERAAASGADAIICDLEDAVAAANKDSARTAIAHWLNGGGSAWVRVNAISTEDHSRDLAAVLGAPGLLGLVVAKAESATDLAPLAARVRLVALIESALGLHRCVEIAQVPGVQRLAFGSIDFALDIDALESDEALLLARSTLVLAARLAGQTAPIDGVSVQLDDLQATTSAARRARDLGFGGKLCIHPKQVAAVAEAFAPTEDELAWARTIIAAADAADGGAVRSGGAMVDAPVLARARRLLARAAD